MPELIRPATPADSEAIAALIGSLTHYFVADGSAPAAQPFLATFSPAAIAGLLCDGDYLCLCAEEQGQLLGVVTLHRPAHLHHLFVTPAAHGRGIARQLWQALKSHLDPAMPVTVNSSEYAVPVYQRLGFTPTAGAQQRNGVRYVPMQHPPFPNPAATSQ